MFRITRPSPNQPVARPECDNPTRILTEGVPDTSGAKAGSCCCRLRRASQTGFFRTAAILLSISLPASCCFAKCSRTRFSFRPVSILVTDASREIHCYQIELFGLCVLQPG